MPRISSFYGIVITMYYLVCALRRVKCADCGVRVEAVPWARPGSRFTRDFEDVVAYALEDPALAPAHLDAGLRWAARSRLAPFVKAARTLRRHRAGILAAIRLGLSNGRLEGLNSRVRLISHRSFGFHTATPLIALIYLCCGGITIELPLR